MIGKKVLSYLWRDQSNRIMTSEEDNAKKMVEALGAIRSTPSVTIASLIDTTTGTHKNLYKNLTDVLGKLIPSSVSPALPIPDKVVSSIKLAAPARSRMTEVRPERMTMVRESAVIATPPEESNVPDESGAITVVLREGKASGQGKSVTEESYEDPLAF